MLYVAGAGRVLVALRATDFHYARGAQGVGSGGKSPGRAAARRAY
jgi:hypothetical protein